MCVCRGGGNLELVPQGGKVYSHSEGEYPQESSQLLKIKAGLLRQKSCNDRFGFTLAEVLITLGIIGVVAAMTLPSVINKYKIKQLRTAFLRSSSVIQNAANLTASEFGYGSFKELSSSMCGTVSKGDSAACKTSNQQNFAAINDFFISQLDVVKKYTYLNILSLKLKVDNFSNLYEFNYGSLYGIGGNTGGLYLLKDNSAISGMAFYHHEPSDGISITFDTNGPHKGPNRYGYDIFLYNTGTWYKLCTKNQDGNLYNGRGCYDYALKDVNPDDNTKGYWDSLY